MKIEKYKWLYQRAVTPLILFLFFWLLYNSFQIQNYNYTNIKFFFEDYLNLFFFTTLIILSVLHTAIEVFHAINDYFSNTKNEKFIKYLIILLYLLILISLCVFIISFSF